MEITGSALARLINAYVGSNWYAILTDSTTFDDDPTMLEVVQEELIQSISYSRQPYTLQVGMFDANQFRAERPAIGAVFTNPVGGVTISYDRLVVISNASPIANTPVTDIDPSNNTITTTEPATNGSKIVLTARPGGMVPPELANQILYVVNSSGSTFQVAATNNGAFIDFSAGTLPLDCRFANGEVEAIEETGVRQLLPGNSRAYQANLNFGKSNANVIVA